METKDLIILKKFHTSHEAFLAKNLLEQHGIECFVHDSNINRIYAQLGDVFGGIKVRVKSTDLDKANEILKRVDENKLSLVDDIEGPPCPSCNSTATELNIQKSGRLSSALKSIFVPESDQYTCIQCGNNWKSKPRLFGFVATWVVLIVIVYYISLSF